MYCLVRSSAVANRFTLTFLIFIGSILGLSAQSSGVDQKALNRAIDHAKNYLLSDETEVDMQSQFLYQYVQRKFDLEPLSSNSLENQVSQEHLFYPFLRLLKGVDPDVDSTVFSRSGSDIDRVTLKSIYCDKFPLEDTFLDTLKEASGKGNYALTHALWSLQLLKENGCLKKLKGSQRVEDEIAREVAKLVANAGFKDDIAIEAMCFLYGMKRMDLIDPTWISIMIGHQASDGGFYRTSKNTLTNSKTTVLALWCMLEYQSGGKRHEPWIH